MDFEERFHRRAPEARFVPIKGIGNGGDGFSLATDNISTEVADCLAPEESKYYEEVDVEDYEEERTGLYDYIEYAVSELARKVLNHSRQNGFIATQYASRSDYVRLAIADYGIGIKESFRGTEHWQEGFTDVDAIKKALEPEVTSKSINQTIGYSNNAGKGPEGLKKNLF